MTKIRSMTKIRCSDNIGIDLDQVIAWTHIVSLNEEKVLQLFFVGADSGFTVYCSVVGCQAFAYLHKLLLDRFAIDLVGKPLCENDDSTVQDESFELPF